MEDKKQIHIILADDDEDDSMLFKEAINDLNSNIRVTLVGNGEQLMDRLYSRDHELPDLIFLDLNMPRKDGHECLAEIKSNQDLDHIPVLIYSTSSSLKHVEQTYGNRAHMYIRKPNSFNELKTLLAQVFNINWKGNFQKPAKEEFFLNEKLL